MPDLTMIVPTRGRPDNLRQLWAAWRATSSSYSLLVAVIDTDDPEHDNYWRVRDEIGDDPHFKMVAGPRLRLGPTLDLAAREAADRSFAVGFLGDDHRPRTDGWDTAYLAELRRLDTGIVYGDDLIQHEALPTQVAMTSDIIRATGHMVPPGAIHMYLDNAWKSLGEALGALSYLPQVVVEHCHPIAGTAEWDAGYREVNDGAVYDFDKAVFEQWQSIDLPRWVQQIKEFPRG
jgi:hypothetical protein